jgi:hypothetical protein
VYLVLEGVALEDVRARMNTLPFVVEGLMTLDYERSMKLGLAHLGRPTFETPLMASFPVG